MIAIIGAGISGLTAGKILQRRGIDFQILEASGDVGGRIRTDHSSGFKLDEGFQVLLTSYPQVKTHVELGALELGAFRPGAVIYQAPGHSSLVADPIRAPRHVLSTLFAPIGGPGDKLRLLKLRTQTQGHKLSTLEYLKSEGLSPRIIDAFFRPFFSGVFLERDLRTDAGYFLFLFARFGEGLACLPARGMQQFPNQLAAPLRPHLRLNAEVESLQELSSEVAVKLTSGEVLKFREVILAVDGLRAQRLLPQLGLSSRKRVVTTVYFSAPKVPANADFLHLNGSGRGRVNHLAFLSAVQPSYGHEGSHLVAVNLLDTDPVDPSGLLAELESWGLFDLRGWRHLKTCAVNYAQPEDMWQGERPIRYGKILLAGDYTQSASIEGAMRAGERAALAVSEASRSS